MNSPAQDHSKERFPWPLFFAAVAGLISGQWLASRVYLCFKATNALREHQLWLVAFGSCGLLCFVAFILHYLHHRFPRPKVAGRKVVQYLLIIVQYSLLLLVILTGGWLSFASEEWIAYRYPHLKNSPVAFGLLAVLIFVVSSILHSIWRWSHEYVIDVEAVKPPPQTPATRLEGAVPAPEKQLGGEPPALAPGLEPVAVWPGAAEIRTLILFVSTPNIVPAVKQDGEATPHHALVTFPAKASAPKPELKPEPPTARLDGQHIQPDINDIDRAAKEAKNYWNWQQLLRALRGHDHLKTVWLIGSPDAATFKAGPPSSGGLPAEQVPGYVQPFGGGKGSFDYLPLCQRFLQSYVPKAAKVELCETPCDFEDFNRLTTVLRTLLRSKKGSGVPPAKVVLDVTGGQKVTSIAGAALTLNNELRFQYVQTNAPFHTKGYDLITQTPPSPHGDP